MSQLMSGCVVVAPDGKHLDRHSNWRKNAGLREAYVHPIAFGLHLDNVAKEVAAIFEATFDQDTLLVELSFGPFTVEEFAARHVAEPASSEDKWPYGIPGA